MTTLGHALANTPPRRTADYATMAATMTGFQRTRTYGLNGDTDV